jgi:TatD DNase family protein
VKWIDIHTHKAYKSQSDVIFIRNAYLLDIENQRKNYFLSNGIHPWEVNHNNQLHLLPHLLNKKKVLALGEIGLDRFKPDFALQIEVFKKQLEIGNQYRKPIILHCVKAYPELISLIQDYTYPIIFHQYEGNSIQTQQLLKKPNCYFSFGRQLFRKHTPIDLLETIPINNIFLETDNLNLSVQACYSKYAQLKNLDLEILQNQLIQNFEEVFGFDS